MAKETLSRTTIRNFLSHEYKIFAELWVFLPSHTIIQSHCYVLAYGLYNSECFAVRIFVENLVKDFFSLHRRMTFRVRTGGRAITTVPFGALVLILYYRMDGSYDGDRRNVRWRFLSVYIAAFFWGSSASCVLSPSFPSASRSKKRRIWLKLSLNEMEVLYMSLNPTSTVDGATGVMWWQSNTVHVYLSHHLGCRKAESKFNDNNVLL